MTHLKIVLFIVITGLLSACSGIQVSQDFVQTADFSAMKTYRWSADILKKEKDTEGNNPLLNSRIHSAVDNRLAAMGYQLTEKPNADFIVSYQTDVKQRLTSDGASGVFSVGFGHFGNFGAIGLGTGTSIRDQDEAALMIDVIDSRDNSLLWRGVSTRYVYTHNDPEELTKTINAHVDAILAQFPPGKAKP
jgi:hypothetical protein